MPHPSADAGRRPAHPGPGPWEGLGGRSPPKNNRKFIAAWCGGAAWTANVNIGSRRGGWGNRVAPSFSGRGPEARAPRPRPLGGFGRAQPSQEEPMFILFVWGGAAWTAEVKIVRRVLPPPPASPRWGEEPGSFLQWGEGQGGGRHRARGAVARAGRPRSRAVCIGRCAPCAWGLTCTYALGEGRGATGLPHAPARGRVWEGAALKQGDGATRLPHPPTP